MKPNDLRRLIEAATPNGDHSWLVRTNLNDGQIRLHCNDKYGATTRAEEALLTGVSGGQQLALYQLIAALLNAAPDILALMEAATEWTEAEAAADAACDDDVEPERLAEAIARMQPAHDHICAAVRRMRGE
jgi:hypothetical protein